jgi:predicted N-acyltransferase
MQGKPDTVTINVLSSISDVDGASWDKLVRANYPFLKHAFLSALEKHRCIGQHVGWLPRHLVYYRNNMLAGAIPLFEKHNSWGEFVFDHAWADAYERYGIDYYPKLVNAIPFTPASGQRVLLFDNDDRETAAILVAAARKLADDGGYSGMHCLFPGPGDYRMLNQQDAVSRNDCQFHWKNRDYTDFDGFLAALKSRKRKNIRQERRKVSESGVDIIQLDGHTASEKDWVDFTRLYENIYNRKYGMPAFNQEFFMDIAATMPDQIHLILARHQHRSIAGALMYSDSDYQGIEFCIHGGVEKFDPGAQGEHKIARGFNPVRTRSLHWMTESPFNQAIRQFVLDEQAGVMRYINSVKTHSPYKQHGNDSFH